MKNGLAGLMKQAQQMNQRMNAIKEEINNTVVQGQSGAGMVTVHMNGKYYASKVEIDPSLLSDDKDMLEDLVTAAINDAVNKIETVSKEKMGQFSNEMGLGAMPGFKFPF